MREGEKEGDRDRAGWFKMKGGGGGGNRKVSGGWELVKKMTDQHSEAARKIRNIIYLSPQHIT